LKQVLPLSAGVNEHDHLVVGGCDTVDIAERFGTPVFVFCEDTFSAKARQFREAFPQASIYYAGKAFLCLEMCRLVKEAGLGLDVATGGEMYVAAKAGFPPEKMILHGNNKQEGDLRQAVEMGVARIAIDNLEEIGTIGAIAGGLGIRQKVVVRVTPGVEAHTHEYIQTGQEDSKFGLSIQGGAALAGIKLCLAQDAIELTGIHCHIGSNVVAQEAFQKTIEILFKFLGELNRDPGCRLSEVNLGGGFGIAHTPSEAPIDLRTLSQMVTTQVAAQSARYSVTTPQLAFEPGRFLVGNAMVTLYRVGAVKEIPGIRTYVSLDGGMSDNIRPALYRSEYSAVIASNMSAPPDRRVALAGMHCESGDILIREAALNHSLKRGDIVAIPATGAYGYSMASNYNKQPRPPVVKVKGKEAGIMVRRETYDDLLRLDSNSIALKSV